MPKISVIVPVYKVEPYLKRCVDSILNQSFKNFELILIDDGSPDNCGAICDDYAMRDNRIYVIHKKNGGLSDARNAGIDWAFANSDSEWITFIDSDDWIHEQYLESLFNAMLQTGKKVIIGNFELTEGTNPNVNTNNLNSIVYTTENFFCKKNLNAILAWGKLYKKNSFQDIRYPVGKLHEDQFTTYKLLFSCTEVAFIDEPIYAYYKNPNGIVRSKWTPKRLDESEALKQQLEYMITNEYKNAEYYIALQLILYWAYLINDLVSIHENHRLLIKKTRKELRKYIRKYKNVVIIPANEIRFVSRMAYPLENRIKRKIYKKANSIRYMLLRK